MTGELINVRLTNQDGTGVAAFDIPSHKLASASLLQYEGHNYTYGHIAGIGQVVFVRCGEILVLGDTYLI